MGWGRDGQGWREMAWLYNWLNLAYRFNSGNAYTGNIYFDWWWRDGFGTHFGAVSTLGDWNCEPASLGYCPTSVMPTNADFVGSQTQSIGDGDSVFTQKLSLDASKDNGTGFSSAVYQARLWKGSKVSGPATAYGSLGWYNTTVGRTQGWHHSRIVVGPLSGSTNSVAFYIDDMTNAQLIGTSTVATYNCLELTNRMHQSSNANYYGGMPNSSTGYCATKYDDISFGSMPPSLL